MAGKAAYYVGNKTFRVGDGQPQAPGPGEVRLQVAYCGICGTDLHIFHGHMDRRVSLGQVIGHEAAGQIVEIGPDVEGFRLHDRVVVRPLKPGAPCPVDNGCTHIGQNLEFMGIDTPGAMQESWTVPASTLHRLPENVSFQHGAMIEPVAVACHDVRIGAVGPGEHAVVIGGGPIGVLVALVARHRGARVLVSEVNSERILLLRELGFATVNPLQEDLVQAVERFTGGAYADVVFEVSGTAPGVAAMTQLPRVRGRIVMVAIHSEPKPVDLFRFFWRELRLLGARVYEPEDFEEAIRLVSQRAVPLDRLITRTAPLEEVQSLFETVSRFPAGMKYLLQCT